ncbi:MAG TPA: hypothetical protein VM221_00500 [Armatimonadota bacterium]|nr:hypothetical protein [Armatimonadota bacterium]
MNDKARRNRQHTPADDRPLPFPVSRVARVIPGKEVAVARRGEGAPVASARIEFDADGLAARLTSLRTRGRPSANQVEAARRTAETVEQALAVLARCAARNARWIGDLGAQVRSRYGAVEVEFLADHDVVADAIAGGRRPTLRLSIEPAAEAADAGRAGLPILYALGLLHQCGHLCGWDRRTCLQRCLDLYQTLRAAEARSLAEALSHPHLDAGKIFLRFLREAAGKPGTERDRWIAWLLGRAFIELPYSSEAVRQAIAQSADLADLRLGIYNAIHDTYVESLDSAHAQRVADRCLEDGVRLVGGRFSRAFYIDAMLMASAKTLAARHLRAGLNELAKAWKRSRLRFADPELRERGLNFQSIGGEVQRLLNLPAADRVSVAQVQGAVGKLKQALRSFETSLLSQMDALESDRGQTSPAPALAGDRAEARRQVDAIFGAIAIVEAALAGAPKSDPAFMVFFQRLFPLDAVNMGLLNELLDPFFGEDEEIHALIRSAGPHMYVTSNLSAWLRRCDDWVEALPAYASYEIVPTDGGYAVVAGVQRSIMEDMYRRHGEDWALNIDAVMASEHICLAREILIEATGLAAEADRRSRRHHISREEAERQIIRRRGWMAQVAILAALIEATYLDLCPQVAQRAHGERTGGMEALRTVLSEAPSPRNLIARAREQAAATGVALAEAGRHLVGECGLDERVEALRPAAAQRRRHLPCVHVLTTLGPGETELHVRNWLEESMALFNVSRGHRLEGEVEQRIADYRSRLAAVGRRIIGELALEGELHRIMLEEGLRPEEEADHEEGILKLIASYPEVATEVATLALLIEHAEQGGQRPRAPRDAQEPQAVLQHLAAHPELEQEAVRQVIADNDLGAAVRARVEQQGMDEAQAARETVAANADWVAEKERWRRSRARRDVIESLGLAPSVRPYLRSRLDRMLATLQARRELIAERGLSAELTQPRFRYEATGPYKRYHLLYTPSRVDLGAEEVSSVRNVPKWVGGADRAGARAGRELYALYNVAGPTAVESPRLAEFLKVGENFFSRGGVFYLSLAAGANLDALGIGDFEFFRDQWNLRGDRMVLPAGETYGGFCVPKEFSLLYAIILAAVNPRTSTAMLDQFGVPAELHAPVIEDLRRLLRAQVDCRDVLAWEARAEKFLAERYDSYFALLGRPGYVARLPQLARTLEMAGGLSAQRERERQLAFQLAEWVNKKALGLEEINRIGPFRKVHLIYRLLHEAREKNPRIAPDDQIIGVMSASYKEGERKRGREIPITDVRFSAGARKLEIYAGTAEHHLLKSLDPEGRELVREMFADWVAPADLRMVGTCTGSDLLNHVPESGLEAIKDEVNDRLLAAGLEQGVIDACCAVYGGDLERWAGIAELPEAERRALIGDIGPRIHLLVLDRRGPYRRYEEAVQGVDFVDLGIPDPELLDLVDDLPKLLALMRRGRPHSALALADGTSGARRRSFSVRYACTKAKVKELFALDDGATYGALGLGRETIAGWREEMVRERDQARELWDAVSAGRADLAAFVYARIGARIIREGGAEEAAEEEIAARKFKVPAALYRYRSEALGRIAQGLPLQSLDYGTWLILGGAHLVNGRMSAEEIQRHRTQFEAAMERIAGCSRRGGGYGRAQVDDLVALLLRPAYVPAPESEYREMDTGISGSLKATEDKVARLEKREARRRQALRAGALSARRQAYAATAGAVAEVVRGRDYGSACERAKAALGDPAGSLSQEAVGEFIAWARGALTILLDRLLRNQSDLRSSLGEQVSTLLDGGEVDADLYRTVAARIAAAAELAAGDADELERIATALELLDIALVVERTQAVDDPVMLTIELARFFDITLNNHVFDCLPYHYHPERGAGFQGLNRQAKFELAARRHRWLYTYIRQLLATRSELAELGSAYHDAWLGDADRGVVPLGVRGEDETQRFWFGYARLRDAAVLRHEGFPPPEIFEHLDPAAIAHQRRANVAIIYPHGNTTVPVALEQGAKLSRRAGINLVLCAFPDLVDDDRYRRRVLHLHDGFMYVSRDDYRAALAASGVAPQEVERRCRSVGEDGVLVLAGFREPVVAHGIFFHFTHPLRPFIGEAQAPLIQPLVWEAATHLKCRLPEMLRASGVGAPGQVNWYRATCARQSPAAAKAAIERDLAAMAARYATLIVKPEKESGGRKAKILPVARDGRPIRENIADLRDLVYDICKTDNAVIQQVLPSHVRQLYAPSFLTDMVARFARIGVPVLLEGGRPTPLFSYFRQIVVLGKDGFETSHHITVVSTLGIANVGQGGLLYEYRDEMIDPQYRADLRRELTEATRASVASEQAYLREHWREILQEYLAVHPEFADDVKLEAREDLTGFPDTGIAYEMGDYMPVMLVDDNHHLVRLYDRERGVLLPLFDREGRPTAVPVCDEGGTPVPRLDASGKPLPLPMFDERGRRIPRCDERGRPISALVVFKIESNPGAGLWRPHDDQLPAERKGEGVYTIFRCLGERAAIYREELGKLAASAETKPPRRRRTGPAPRYLSGRPSGGDALERAIKRASEELGRGPARRGPGRCPSSPPGE